MKSKYRFQSFMAHALLHFVDRLLFHWKSNYATRTAKSQQLFNHDNFKKARADTGAAHTRVVNCDDE
ncbi:MAG TPA: hypothetical protein VK469_11495 [Candidatus Kapabacteria bacterium]|nr:hypothetical protein [Candidatus Kapabacteria bacterium]